MNDSGSACSSERRRRWREQPKRMTNFSSSGLPTVSSHRHGRTGLGRITSLIRKRVRNGGYALERLSLDGPSSQLGCLGPNWDTRCLPSMVCARRVADAPSIVNRGAAVAKGARLSGKREGVPGFSERSCQFRYVGITVIWRRRDAQTLRPTGNGRIVDRLDIDGVAL
jgi:hypothetical protein